MAIRYVSDTTCPFYRNADDTRAASQLLWGDQVDVLETSGSRFRVRARGRQRFGFVPQSAIGDQSLLEVYVIDVGQGDGILVRFPDGRHILVDGGYTRTRQQSRKSAADFVDWKFFEDYARDEIHLEAMIASHPDADHYGGLWDLLNAQMQDDLDATSVLVDVFYHSGVSWWKEPGHDRWLGPEANGRLTRLLGDRASAIAATNGSQPFQLQGEWGEFIEAVLAKDCGFQRLSHRNPYVPGFEPAPGAASMRVLAPVEVVEGELADLGSSSVNTNGHSILLRLDYGRVRILLTGDLNKASQRALLDHYVGQRLEFACDVAKACHHGSGDVSYEFLGAMSPLATIISSGDSEQHSHPRPEIVAASGITGYRRIENDRLVTPLVYSTEISRSIRMGRITGLVNQQGLGLPTAGLKLEYSETAPGDLNPRRGKRPVDGAYVVSGMIYGLVNVRTDGSRILCATLNEKKRSWDVFEFESRF
jgi:beta-lactamase superfamily II metal-dependent hydrolase